MKLDRTQLSKMIHHVLSYDFDEQGELHFRRFTEAQREAYKAASLDWFIRTKASAGVTFDFVTDSAYIVLQMKLDTASSKTWSDFDLYIDGIFTNRKKFPDIDAKLLHFILPEGEHRITLYFPWTVETVVSAVYLSDGASVKAVSKKAKAIVIGDSITQGYITEYTSLTYTNRLARELELELVNQGIGGCRCEESTIDESLLCYKPDLIVFAYGTNDYTKYDAREEFCRNTSRYLEKLTSLFPQTKIVALLPIYRNDGNHQTREIFREYSFEDARNILLETYAGYKNITVVKETKIPHIPEVFAPDYLHPNELGFQYMAEAIIDVVKDEMELK